MGPGLGADEPRRQPPAAVHMVERSQVSATSVCVPTVSHSHPPPCTSPGDSPRPAGRPDPGSYPVTAFALVPGTCEISCVPFKNEVSVFPSPVGLPKLSPSGLQSQMLWGLAFLVQDPRAGEPDVGLRTLTPVGIIILQFVGRPPRCVGFDYIRESIPPTHLSHCGSFFVFSCRRSFLVASILFHWWWFCR